MAPPFLWWMTWLGSSQGLCQNAWTHIASKTEFCKFVSFPPPINIAVYARKWKQSSVGIYLLRYQSHSKDPKSTGQYKGKVSTLNIITAWWKSLVVSVSRRFVFIDQSASTCNAIPGMNTGTSIQDKVVQTSCNRSSRTVVRKCHTCCTSQFLHYKLNLCNLKG